MRRMQCPEHKIAITAICAKSTLKYKNERPNKSDELFTIAANSTNCITKLKVSSSTLIYVFFLSPVFADQITSVPPLGDGDLISLSMSVHPY